MSDDDKSDEFTGKDEEEPTEEPTTPKEIELVQEPGVCFLSFYASYVSRRTDAPPRYHIANALVHTGHILGRDAEHPLKPFPIHHNLYAIEIGRSRKTRKTTAQKLAKDLLLPEYSFTPKGSYEGVFDTIEENPYSMLCIDEGEEFLRTCAGRGSYARQLLPFLSTLYDCPREEHRTTKKGGTQIILKPYISLIMGIQPSAFEELVTGEMLDQGFFNRPMIVNEEPQREKKRTYLDDKELKTEAEILRRWDFAKEYARDHKLTFKFDFGVLEKYHQYCQQLEERFNKIEELDSLVEEMKTVMIKVADIFAYSQHIMVEYNKTISSPSSYNKHNSHTSHTSHARVSTYRGEGVNFVKRVKNAILIPVSELDLDRAFYWAGGCLEDAATIYSGLREEHHMKIILRFLRRYGGKMRRPRLLRYSHLKAKDFDEACETLVDRKQLKILKYDPKVDAEFKDREFEELPDSALLPKHKWIYVLLPVSEEEEGA